MVGRSVRLGLRRGLVLPFLGGTDLLARSLDVDAVRVLVGSLLLALAAGVIGTVAAFAARLRGERRGVSQLVSSLLAGAVVLLIGEPLILLYLSR